MDSSLTNNIRLTIAKSRTMWRVGFGCPSSPIIRKPLRQNSTLPRDNFASPKVSLEGHCDQVCRGVRVTAHTRYGCPKGLMIGLGFSAADRGWIIGAG